MVFAEPVRVGVIGTGNIGTAHATSLARTVSGSRVTVVHDADASRAASLALQRDSEVLLLLIPEADGRGRGVLSGKVFEYIAVGRPILAAVPPDGAAAQLIRETSAGVVASPDDPSAIREALDALHGRWRKGDLADVELSDEWRRRLSRRTRVEEMAALLEDVTAS